MAARWNRLRDDRLILGKWMHEENAKEGKASNDRWKEVTIREGL